MEKKEVPKKEEPKKEVAKKPSIFQKLSPAKKVKDPEPSAEPAKPKEKEKE